MKKTTKMLTVASLGLLLNGCIEPSGVLNGAISGAVNSALSGTGLNTGGSGNSGDFLSSGAGRKECRYTNSKRCNSDYGSVSVTTEINRENISLVRYGNLIEGASGGQLKESAVSEQMFAVDARGLIISEQKYFIYKNTTPVRPGTYYFKGQYGPGNSPALAVGTITIQPGVTNVINVTYR